MPCNKKLGTKGDDIFLYQRVHDHDFSFLTIGYLGTGYETTIYEYDALSVKVEVGEKVNMKFLETTRLTKGKIMYYRESKDIHTQLYPEELSLSINLIPYPQNVIRKNQFFFDTKNSTIENFAKNNAAKNIFVCKLARLLGNANTVDILTSFAALHPYPRLRAEAYHALIHLKQEDKSFFIEKALADPSWYVRSVFD